MVGEGSTLGYCMRQSAGSFCILVLTGLAFLAVPGFSSVTGTPTVPGAPTPPALISITTGVSQELTIDWTLSPECDVDIYTIYFRKVRSGAIFSNSVVRDDISDASGYQLIKTGLENCQNYDVWVKSTDIRGNESIASAVLTDSPEPCTPPVAPTGLVATPLGFDTIQLTWNANSELDISAYIIYYDADGSGTPYSQVVDTQSVSTTYSLTGLSYCQPYYISISAVDDQGDESDLSSEVVSTILVPEAVVSNVPSLEIVVNGATAPGQFTLANTGCDDLSYTLTTPAWIMPDSATGAIASGASSAITFTFDGSVGSGHYSGNVSIAYSNPNSPVYVPLLMDVVPNAPTNLVVTPSIPGVLDISWDASIDPLTTGYFLYYDNDASGQPYQGNGATEGSSPIDIGNVTSYQLTNLDGCIYYYFALKAYVDPTLVGPYSVEASGQPEAGIIEVNPEAVIEETTRDTVTQQMLQICNTGCAPFDYSIGTSGGEGLLDFAVQFGYDSPKRQLFESSQPTGITWDGTFVLVADKNSTESYFHLYQVNASDGTIVSELSWFQSHQLTNVKGMTWVEGKLYVTAGNQLIMYDGSTGAEEAVWSLGFGSNYWGIEWDGTNFWQTEYGNWDISSKIHKVDLDPILQTITPLSGSPYQDRDFRKPKGITWDGEFLWIASSSNNNKAIRKIDPSNGDVLETQNSPGNTPNGLSFNGFIWNSDDTGGSEKVFKIGTQWLTYSPVTGTVPVSSCVDITLTFDSNGLSNGVYETDLIISSDADNETTTTVHVTMNVADYLIDEATPGYGTTAGGTLITLTGTSGTFTNSGGDPTIVLRDLSLSPLAVSNVTYVSDVEMTFKTLQGLAGEYDVFVTNPDGTEAVAFRKFEYANLAYVSNMAEGTVSVYGTDTDVQFDANLLDVGTLNIPVGNQPADIYVSKGSTAGKYFYVVSDRFQAGTSLKVYETGNFTFRGALDFEAELVVTQPLPLNIAPDPVEPLLYVTIPTDGVEVASDPPVAPTVRFLTVLNVTDPENPTLDDLGDPTSVRIEMHNGIDFVDETTGLAPPDGIVDGSEAISAGGITQVPVYPIDLTVTMVPDEDGLVIDEPYYDYNSATGEGRKRYAYVSTAGEIIISESGICIGPPSQCQTFVIESQADNRLSIVDLNPYIVTGFSGSDPISGPNPNYRKEIKVLGDPRHPIPPLGPGGGGIAGVPMELGIATASVDYGKAIYLVDEKNDKVIIVNTATNDLSTQGGYPPGLQLEATGIANLGDITLSAVGNYKYVRADFILYEYDLPFDTTSTFSTLTVGNQSLSIDNVEEESPDVFLVNTTHAGYDDHIFRVTTVGNTGPAITAIGSPIWLDFSRDSSTGTVYGILKNFSSVVGFVSKYTFTAPTTYTLANENNSFDPLLLNAITIDTDGLAVIAEGTNLWKMSSDLSTKTLITDSFDVGVSDMITYSSGAFAYTIPATGQVKYVDTNANPVEFGLIANGLSEPVSLTEDEAKNIIIVDKAAGEIYRVVYFNNEIAVGDKPVDAVYADATPSAGDEYVFVANALDNTLSVIDVNQASVVDTIPLNGQYPTSLAARATGDKIYTTNFDTDNVSVVSTSMLGLVDVDPSTAGTQALPTGDGPRRIAIQPIYEGSGSFIENANALIIGAPISAFKNGKQVQILRDFDLLEDSMQRNPDNVNPVLAALFVLHQHGKTNILDTELQEEYLHLIGMASKLISQEYGEAGQ